MFFVRWIPTFLAFPLSGLISMLLIGPNENPLTALATGAVVGAIVGGAQWLALGRLTDWRWGVGTLASVMVGGTLSMLVAGPAITPAAATMTGLITGIAVGAAQGVVLRSTLQAGLRVLFIWTVAVGLTWAAAWFITSLVIVDLDRAHAVFGASGAIVTTIVTGVVLRILLGDRARRTPKTADKALATSVTGKGE